jgi:hypothetical protein
MDKQEKPTCVMPGCERPARTKGYCNRHHLKWLRHGDPNGKRERHHGVSLRQRMAIYTALGPDCWEWRGARNARGYGVINDGTRIQLAHRMTWLLEHGTVPAHLSVMHRCDNPACVRLSHLFIGTRADNNADMIAKGRARSGSNPPRGEIMWAAKLTEDVVREIRNSKERGIDLARRYDVTKQTITDIRKRRSWAHVE